MNIKFYALLCSVLVIGSCAERREGEEKNSLVSNFISITDNEDKGVKEILKGYGGYCKYAVGFSLSTDGGKQKYFELELSKSDLAESYSKKVEMTASNIAYLFYRNLQNEKANYDEIHSVVVFKDGVREEFIYSREKLELVMNKMDVVNRVVQLMKEKDFNGVNQILKYDETFGRYDKSRLIDNLAKMDPDLGVIEKFSPYGFSFYKLNGKELLHISGVLVRDKKNNQFSVDMEPASSGDTILRLQYKL